MSPPDDAYYYLCRHDACPKMYMSRSYAATIWHENNAFHALCCENCVVCSRQRNSSLSKRKTNIPTRRIPASFFIQRNANSVDESFDAALALIKLATQVLSQKEELKKKGTTIVRDSLTTKAKLGVVTRKRRPKSKANKRRVL